MEPSNLYLGVSKTRLSDMDIDYLAEKLELEAIVIDEKGEKVIISESLWENPQDSNDTKFYYFFRKAKLDSIDLTALKSHGLVLKISSAQEKEMSKRLDLSQFSVELS